MKAWSKPELVVLRRGTPQEAVLADCKTGGESGTSQSNANQGNCKYGYFCSTCDKIAKS